MFQKLNDAQQHYAKVEILNVIRYAQNYHPPPHRTNTVSPASTGYQPPSQFAISNLSMQSPGHLQIASQPHRPNNIASHTPEYSTGNYYMQFAETVLSPTAGCASPALSDNSSELFDLSQQ